MICIMENYSIRFVSDKGWRKYPNQKAPLTGTQLESKSLKEILDYCTSLPDDGMKGTHGAIFTYDKPTVGNASVEYYKEISYDGVLFVDLDHIPSDLVDKIFENFEDISLASNNAIIACQKSSSYYRRPGTDDTGVHFFVASQCGDGYQYGRFATYALGLVAAVINKVIGVDVRKYDRGNEKVLDTHSCKISQRLFLYHSDYRYNDVVIPITEDSYRMNVDVMKTHYPELFWGEVEEFEVADLTGIKVIGKVEGKIRLDYSKECIISNFLTTIGWKPEKILQTLLEIDSRDRQEYFKKHNQSLEKHFKQIIRTSATHKNVSEQQKRIAIDLLEKCGINIEENKTEDFKKQEKNRLTKIEMADDKWMSDYIDTIEKHISKEQILTISAPTGTGKTTMLEAITKKYHHNALILVPFNATNQLYEWSNIVSSERVSDYKSGEINTMIWDQFVKHYSKIEKGSDIIFVDESHTLFLDRTYRDVASTVWKLFEVWKALGRKIVFISATPAGEILKSNCRILKFIKKDDRDIKVNIIRTNDTLTALESDINSGDYDRVCIFSNRDVKILYARMCVNGKHTDAKIYHSEWRANVDQLKISEKLTSRVNLLTCVAFNGLNIRNTNEKIMVSIRYTKGETTLNEIIQIVGRFRNNKDITLNIYVDNKFTTFEDLDELFSNAKVITDYEGNDELRSEYYERLCDPDIQGAYKEIEAYMRMWVLGNIIREMKVRYPISVLEKTFEFEKDHIVKRSNPIKKQASELMIKWLAGAINDEEFHNAYSGTEMEGFIRKWNNDLEYIKKQVGKNTGVIDVVTAECTKQNTLVENAIKKINRILWVVGKSQLQWSNEVANRATLKNELKGDKMIKHAMSQFKKDDSIREKYAEFINDGVEEDVIEDPEALFRSVVENVNKEVLETVNKKSAAHSKSHKQHKLHMFKCEETGELKTKPEWLQVLGCSIGVFNKLIIKGLYKKVK